MKNYRLVKGYDSPIKYDWLVGAIELDFLKVWKPEHVESKNTTLRIEVENESIRHSVEKTIKKLLIKQNEIAEEIEQQLLKFYISDLHSDLIEGLEWLKSMDVLRYKAQLKEYPIMTMEDIEHVKDSNYLSEIYIPLQKTEGNFGVVIESKWEEEHGIGLIFEDFKFKGIGSSEIATEIDNDVKKIIEQEQLKDGIVFPTPPPIYKYLKDLDYIVHWEWSFRLNKYQIVKKMKGDISKWEIEIQ